MDLQRLRSSVIEGDAVSAERELKHLLADGAGGEFVLTNALIPAMDVVGEKFSTGEYFTPEMLASAVIMKQCVNVLRPLLVSEPRESSGNIVIGTVKGDLHDIGKNLVAMMLEGAGFSVTDLGVDVSSDTFVEAVREHRPQLLGLSCLLTTTLPMMKQTVAALEHAGIRNDVKVLIGGAPVTCEMVEVVGADGYASDAGAAARTAKELLSVV